MAALSFVASVASRPIVAPVAGRKVVSTEVNAIGGFGPNMPADEYRQKMEAKKKLIADNKAKAGAKKGSAALFGFGKKKAEAAPAPKKVGFGVKKAATPAPKAAAPAPKKRFGEGLPGRRKGPIVEEKKKFSLFGKK